MLRWFSSSPSPHRWYRHPPASIEARREGRDGRWPGVRLRIPQRPPRAFHGIAERVDHVIVLVLQHASDLIGQLVDLVGVERQFIDQALAARMDDEIIALQELDTLLERASALERRGDAGKAIVA